MTDPAIVVPVGYAVVRPDSRDVVQMYQRMAAARTKRDYMNKHHYGPVVIIPIYLGKEAIQ